MTRLFPDTILGRTVLVLVAALAVSLTVALTMFAGQRHEALTSLGGRNAAERVAALVTFLEETAPDDRRHTLRAMDTPGFRAGWGTQPLATIDGEDRLSRIIRRHLARELEGRPVRVSTTETAPAPQDVGFRGGNRGMHRGGAHATGPRATGTAIRISVQLTDASWLNVVAPIAIAEPEWRPGQILPLGAALVAVILAALWAVARAARPFGTFAAAAERLGLDVAAPPLTEDGPREIRRAAHAFNVMQGRIRRLVEDRTRMLAAISHDLRTPITRLKLRAEFIDDESERARLLADLDEMERMIAATLIFARDDAAHEERRAVDVAALVQGLVEDCAALGARSTYAGPDSLVTQARPLALKRALANLLENAIKYGGQARAILIEADGEVAIIVEDDGPGIPPADFERVFQPFVRLEESRNRDTGGSGLGLAVARAAARAHGGDIHLENMPQGGLRVKLTLPRARIK